MTRWLLPLRVAVIVTSTLLLWALGGLVLFLLKGEALLTMRLAHPIFLLGALVVPFVVYHMTVGADSRVPRLRMAPLLPLAKGPRGIRSRLRDLPGILRGTALFFAFVAMSRPESVLRGEDSEERGIDIVIVLDLSGSMRAVLDNAGTPSPALRRGIRPTRLDVAKEVIVDFIRRRKSDRIGVVVFGRAAFVLSPPTLDYTLLTSLVQKMDLETIDGSGTAIGDAVGTAVARLRRSTARSKTVILLTDGDSNAGSVSPEYAEELAKTQGVRIYTVQIGSDDEVDVLQSVDMLGQPRYGRAKYPVNPELLRKMAKETGAQAFVATDRKALEASMHSILDQLEKTRFMAQAATMEQLFPFFLVPGVLLFALEALVRVILLRRFP